MSRLKLALKALEKDLIKHALQLHQFNRTKAARDLGISRPALVYKIKNYGLPLKVPKRKWQNE